MDEKQIVELIVGCKLQDRVCQNELYKLYYQYVLTIAMRYASSMDEAKEIVNDTFYKVFTKIETFKEELAFRPWLCRVAIHSSIDYYRKYIKDTPENIDLDAIAEQGYNDSFFAQINTEELLRCVQKLPPAYRIVLGLYALEGYSHKEIAIMLKITEGTSKSNLFKARDKLKRLLSEINYFPSLKQY